MGRGKDIWQVTRSADPKQGPARLKTVAFVLYNVHVLTLSPMGSPTPPNDLVGRCGTVPFLQDKARRPEWRLLTGAHSCCSSAH